MNLEIIRKTRPLPRRLFSNHEGKELMKAITIKEELYNAARTILHDTRRYGDTPSWLNNFIEVGNFEVSSEVYSLVVKAYRVQDYFRVSPETFVDREQLHVQALELLSTKPGQNPHKSILVFEANDGQKFELALQLKQFEPRMFH